MDPVSVDQPWYCERCGADAKYTHMSDVDAGTVKNGVLEQHHRMSPKCPVDSVPPIRFRERAKVEDKSFHYSK